MRVNIDSCAKNTLHFELSVHASVHQTDGAPNPSAWGMIKENPHHKHNIQAFENIIHKDVMSIEQWPTGA